MYIVHRYIHSANTEGVVRWKGVVLVPYVTDGKGRERPYVIVVGSPEGSLCFNLSPPPPLFP